MVLLAVRKQRDFEVFVPLSSIERRFQNDHFTKTGSGQTQRKALHSKQKNAAYVLHAPFERTGDPGRLSEIQRPRPVRKMPLFLSFPFVCPEPVSAK